MRLNKDDHREDFLRMVYFVWVGLMALLAIVEISASTVIACLAFRVCRWLITQE